jgi:hypothetical protein
VPNFTADVIHELFGAEDAENEDAARLKQYFYRNRAYESLTADVPIRVVVGHKGVGKSALLKMAHLEDLEAGRPSVWLKPSDLTSLDGTYDTRFDKATLAWQTGLLQVLFAKAMQVLTGTDQVSGSNLLLSTSKDLLSALKKLAKDKVGLETSATDGALLRNLEKTERLYVYLDDLDWGWQGRPTDIHRISALLNSLRDICGQYKGVQFRIGLRSDVYHLVRTSDESTDKIAQYLIPLAWDSHDILVCMAKRVATFFGEHVTDAKLTSMPQPQIAQFLHRVIEERFNGLGKWEKAPIHIVLLSLTRRRPRDLVKLLSGAAHEAFRKRHELVTSEDLQSTFVAYSQDRLQDIINEFKSELPNIKDLVLGMKPNKAKHLAKKTFLYTNDELSKKLNDVKSSTSLRFANGDPVTVNTLRNFLFKIDFIIARNELSDGSIAWVFFDQNRFGSDSAGDFGYHWEVHPAYRWALERRSVQDIIDGIDLGKTA